HVLDRLRHATPPSLMRNSALRRQRLFDREKIPPGKTLLQRLAQEISRMQRRYRADLARAGLKRKPTPTGLEDTVFAVEQRLRRRAAETDQDVRVGKFDLTQRERQTDGGLLRRRRAIARWAPRHDVGDIGAAAV